MNLFKQGIKSFTTLFPIDPAKVDKTTGAATITTTDMDVIIFDTDVTVYFDGNSSATYNWSADIARCITKVSSIHVNTAVNYMYV